MNYSTPLQIGDVIPITPRRGILSDRPIDPVWHPIRVPPGREMDAVAMLRRNGVEAFVPTEERERRIGGVRKMREVATVTQIIYAKFCYQPNWDVLKQRRIITGVFCVGSRPVVLPPDAIRIVRGLPTRAEEMEAARLELLRVNAGDPVKLVSGPFDGMRVSVTGSTAERVWWSSVLSSGLPISGEAHRDDVEKLRNNNGKEEATE